MDSALFRLRHSLAHVMAQAVRDHFHKEGPVHFAGGPPIQDGFYYDFGLPRALVPEDLPAIEARMKAILQEGHAFHYREIDAAEGRKLFAAQPYKLELLEGLVQGGFDEHGEPRDQVDAEPISIYQHADFIDLCRGPHVKSCQEIPADSFKLVKIAGAYWRGDEKRPMLQRIQALAFADAAELQQHNERLEQAALRDHRKLGKELKLFFFHATAPGMPYWLPQGFAVLNQLINWWRDVHEREQYAEISSPLINSKKLWEISGHWDHYRDDMFVMALNEDEVYGVKPMNCPNAMIVFNHERHSYRDLPLRLSDCDALHRHERSGALHGLLRVQKFQQDDAHIFVEDHEDAIHQEFLRILQLVDEFYRVFRLSYRFRLATQPSDALGEAADWERAEACLRRVLDQHAGDYEVAAGDGAFYGPKIDILIQDALGRDWQMGTLQLDFQLPRRFDCQYVDREGQRKHPAVIHRVIYGSMERFIGILIEHCAGKFPLWLAPVQVRLLPIADRHEDFARLVQAELKKARIRVELDADAQSLGNRIRKFRGERIPYAVVIGDQEVAAGRVSLRSRDADGLESLSVDALVQKLREEIQSKVMK
ncbi:threonine--tRNA ligase [Oligoflexus tunisiensis]|uniref:threonine--tRNA ligase n=1 Tax=Oligoflexus tunisiensis TaxID=708132 RepID=UPI000AB8820D|nr:threonine--tRNA ligase [Oligoflexus tunisiensis]